MTSLQDRMPNTRCASAIVRRASLAGRNGPAKKSPAPSSTLRATSTRGNASLVVSRR